MTKLFNALPALAMAFGLSVAAPASAQDDARTHAIALCREAAIQEAGVAAVRLRSVEPRGRDVRVRLLTWTQTGDLRRATCVMERDGTALASLRFSPEKERLVAQATEPPAPQAAR